MGMDAQEFAATLTPADARSTAVERVTYLASRTRFVRDEDGALYEVDKVVTREFTTGSEIVTTYAVEGIKLNKNGQRPDRSNYSTVIYDFIDVSDSVCNGSVTR